MGLSSILLRIEKKGKVELAKPVTPSTNNGKPSATKTEHRRPTPNRPIDPVVARLKEKRRLEREEKERAERERKGLKPVQKKSTANKSTTGRTAPRQKQQVTSQQNRAPSSQALPPRPAPKKQLNYAELMKKASAINTEKLSINLLNKSKSPEAEQQRKSASPVPPKPTPHKPTGTSVKPVKKQTSVPAPRPPKLVVRTPLPTRQPSNKIKERLEQKKMAKSVHERDDYDDDDDLDSFVEDDEEEEDDYNDNHRSEIWAMFNRGKKRSYYADDYDSDDMEATGAEIFDEEFQSRLDAEMEDRKEMEREKRLQALKKKRLGR